MSTTSSSNSNSDDENNNTEETAPNDRIRVNVQNLLNVLTTMYPGISVATNDLVDDDTLTDIVLRKDLNKITNSFYFDYTQRAEKEDMVRFCKMMHTLINVVHNVFKNSIFMGDIISDLYLNDNYIQPFYNVNNMKTAELIVLVEEVPGLSFENVINMIILMSKSSVTYYYSTAQIVIMCLNMKDSHGNIYDITLTIGTMPHLFKLAHKSKCPYELKDKVYLNCTDKDLYYYTLDLLRFEHQRLAIIKTNMFSEYVEMRKYRDGYFIDRMSGSLTWLIESKTLRYMDPALNPQREIEYYLRYDFNLRTRQPLILSRLNMYIQTNIILKYVYKGWTFKESLKRIPFLANDSCFICYHDYEDFINQTHNKVDLFKITYNCCKESEQGICVQCFINTVKTCHRALRSNFICPFCKKSNTFYSEQLCAIINEESD